MTAQLETEAMTMRVHEIARPLGLPSLTVIWLLRLIGHKPKTPASRVTMSDIEWDVFRDVLALHIHQPMMSTVVPLSHNVLSAKCVCGVVMRATNVDNWSVTRSFHP